MKGLVLLLLSVTLSQSRKPVEGPQGYPGVQGPDGPIGLQGQKGQPGDPGPPGKGSSSAVPGPPGDDGLPGLKGGMGDPGNQGIAGINGVDGFPGQPGSVGSKGPRGDPGVDGLPGKPGLKGEPGIPGEDCGCPSDELIAFSGMYLDVDEPSSTHRSLKLDTILADYGSLYNDASSSFRIPKSGQYFFSIVAVANGNSAVPIVLVYNGIEVLSTVGDRDSKALFPVGVNRVAMDLKQDDRIDLLVKSRESSFFGSIFNKVYSKTDVTVSAYYIN